MAIDSDAIIAPEKRSPHFLFTGTKYLLCDPTKAENALATFTYNSLRNANYGSFDFLAIDRYVTSEQPYDQDLLDLCRLRRPDVFVVVWWPLGHNARNPSYETLYTIREQLKIPIVAMWYDTWEKRFVVDAEALSDHVDVSIISDSLGHFKDSPKLPRFVNLVPPFCQRVFQDRNLNRDINVSFNGAVGAYPDRQEGLQYLVANGIEVVKAGGQMEQQLALDDYARIYMRSKISLNWTRSGEKTTLKGRAFEATLCGSMLLESECAETAKFLTPYQDYVPFVSNQDLLEKVQYYLAHEDERQAIANNGKRKAAEITDGKQYWSRIYQYVTQNHSWHYRRALAPLLEDLVRRGMFPRVYDRLLEIFQGYQTRGEVAWCDEAPTPTVTQLLDEALARRTLEPIFVKAVPQDQHCPWIQGGAGTLVVQAQWLERSGGGEGKGSHRIRIVSLHPGNFEHSLDLYLDVTKRCVHLQVMNGSEQSVLLYHTPNSWKLGESQTMYIRYAADRISLSANGVHCATANDPKIYNGLNYLKVYPAAEEHPQYEVKVQSISYNPRPMWDLESYLRGCLEAP